MMDDNVYYINNWIKPSGKAECKKFLMFFLVHNNSIVQL